LAGPATGLFFAELGAKVTKVENKKTGGDVTRTWKLPQENKNKKTSAYYDCLNYSKKIIFADLSLQKDKNKILNLLKTADVVIVNFKKGDDRKIGFDYPTLKKNNPKIIYAAINGFGENDDRLAYDLILQAESGFMSMNGSKESGPLKMPVALIDIIAAHQLKQGILLAMINKMKFDVGMKISVSLFDAAIASLANQAANFLNVGHVPGLQGSLHPNIAPYGEIFVTKDKKLITFAIGNDKQFLNLLKIINRDYLILDKRFTSNVLRVKNRKILFKVLNQSIQTFTAAQLKKMSIAAFVPYAQIKNLKEVFSDLKSKKTVFNHIHKNKNGQYLKSYIFNNQ